MTSRTMLIAIPVLALSACASSPSYYPRDAYQSPGYSAQVRCYDCGVIERIDKVYGARSNSGTGAVLGGIVGAVIGRELAGDHTSSRNKNAGTAAGAVAGAVAGHAMENKANEETWDISIRMDDGRRIIINRNLLGNHVRVGAYVRVEGNRILVLR